MSDRPKLEGLFGAPAAPRPQADPVVDVRATTAPISRTADPGLRPVTIYVPREVGQRLRETTRNREMTYTEVVIARYTGAVDVGLTGSVMPQPVGARRRRRDGRMRDRSDFQIRLDGNQLAWLDHQVEMSGAGSRSAFVTLALQLHLGLPV